MTPRPPTAAHQVAKVFRYFFSRNAIASSRASVSVLFGISSVPIIGLLGLAVDVGIWNQSNATLSVAANVAAMTAAKVAVNAQLAGDPNAVAEGEIAGKQWFLTQIGSASNVGVLGVTLPQGGASVTVTGAATMTATVQYTASVRSIFGNYVAHIGSYPVDGQATAQIASSPYLNVEILLDDSGSMEIGASNSDIIHLQEITPCYTAESGQAAPDAFYNGSTSNLAGQSYNAYSTSGYDGGIPVPAQAPDPPLSYASYPSNGNATGPSCQGVLPVQTNGQYPLAGPPCAFACHFDTSKPAGSGNDFYALARATIGTANPITLRFDLVKAATNQIISTMQADNIAALNNLNVGIFTFANSLLRVYPVPACGTTTACESGNDWATAIGLVGAPPTAAKGADTGIQPYGGANGGNSDFHDTMVSLSGTYLTASGDGTTASKPRKVLFIVTDGLVDYTDASGNRTEGGVSAADCALFKSKGYTVYVVYTPYYPVMNGYYYSNIKSLAEPTATGTLASDLEACASDPVNDYVSATDQTGLNNALQKFLKSALTQPARFTL
jgi:Flp pilus assembly protein TadG